MANRHPGSIFILVPIITCGLIAATPVEYHGNLSVSGGKVVNQHGAPAEIRGMSLFWSQWGGQFWNSSVVRWLAGDWKSTVVRAAMAVEAGGYLTDQNEHKNLVKTVVDAAITGGIYVVIDWHDHNATYHLSQAKSFFAEMAQTYGDKPNVIYEIFNEPVDETWDQLKSYSNSLIAEIRKYDPDNLIVVPTPHWDRDVDVAANSPLSGTNLAYGFHFYASDQWHQEGAALKGGYCLVKGACAVCDGMGRQRVGWQWRIRSRENGHMGELDENQRAELVQLVIAQQERDLCSSGIRCKYDRQLEHRESVGIRPVRSVEVDRILGSQHNSA